MIQYIDFLVILKVIKLPSSYERNSRKLSACSFPLLTLSDYLNSDLLQHPGKPFNIWMIRALYNLGSKYHACLGFWQAKMWGQHYWWRLDILCTTFKCMKACTEATGTWETLYSKHLQNACCLKCHKSLKIHEWIHVQQLLWEVPDTDIYEKCEKNIDNLALV